MTDSDARPLDIPRLVAVLLDAARNEKHHPRLEDEDADDLLRSLASSLAALGRDAEQLAQIRVIASEPHYQGAPMLTSKHFDRSAAIVNVNWYHRLMDAIAAPDPERSTPA